VSAWQNDSAAAVREVERIVTEGEKGGIVLRVLAGVAVRCHCPKYSYILDAMKRVRYDDIDLGTYSKFRPLLKSLFLGLGYKADEQILLFFGHDRHEYFDERNSRKADVFIDKLEYCHRINLIGRLELDRPTAALSDILLQKMQIVKINDKDIEDTIVLLREHGVGDGDKETINARHIADLLSEDWGFYYTVTTNLKKVSESLARFDCLTEEDREDVSLKVARMLQYIESASKSRGWKARALLGPRKKWYNDLFSE
jgi:hypothetical protein